MPEVLQATSLKPRLLSAVLIRCYKWAVNPTMTPEGVEHDLPGKLNHRPLG
jgi:hypothetical protein